MWEQTTKDNIWRDIVSEKIRKQADFLRETGYEEQAILLSGYTGQIELADATNREGHAAKYILMLCLEWTLHVVQIQQQMHH